MRGRTCLLAALAAAALSAQTITTGEVTGTVLDSAGSLVPSTTVRLKSIDTGESRTVQSNGIGVYRIPFVKPGAYEISGTSAGLKSDTGRLLVAVGQVQAIDLTLKPEEPKETVLVTDAAPLLETDNANTTYTLSTRQLELLPLPGGDLVAVAYSMPGVVINSRYGNGNFAAQGHGSMSNLFTVNGVDDMDPYWNVNNSGTTGLLLGANEVREASIVQNAYEAQYGRQAGAQVNYVTKSGTNAFHGNLAHNYNGTVMNANDFFNNSSGAPRPHGVSNQYAAAFGGPVVRDKLFFFADTEGMRFAQPAAASVVVVPSPAFESYSMRTIQPSQIPLYRQLFDLYSRAPGHERAVAVTNGLGTLQDSNGTLGCGTLAGTPTGTGGVFGKDVSCAQAWSQNVPSQVSEWLFSTRVDYNLSARQRIFFRFKMDHGSLPFGINAINPAFSGISVQPDYEGQLNHTFVISPRLVNNFIGSANYNDYVFADTDQAQALKLFPFRFNTLDGGANGFSGFAGIGAPAAYPSGRRAGQLQIVDDLSYSAGRHSFKAGMNYRFHREADLSYSAFSYVGRFTFFTLGELASGELDPSTGSNYTQRFTTTPTLHLRLYNAGFYIQDQWAVTPRLKVIASMRFDRTGNPHCLDRCFARLTVPFAELQKGLSIPYNQSIQTGLTHAFYGVEPIVPQPRFSLVYNPGWSKSTVVRGGIGVFSDLYAAFFASSMAGNAPNVFTPTIKTGLADIAGPASAPGIALASATALQSRFASGATLSQLQQAVAPATFVAPSYLSVPSTMRAPKYVEWSLEVQHQFAARNVLTLRYAGNHGYDIFLADYNLNANANSALYPNGFGGLPAAIPDPRFGSISQTTNDGYSNYHGLTATWRRGLGRGFEGQFSYTWSHALDTMSNGGLVGFSYDSVYGRIGLGNPRSLSYGNADYDTRHNATADFIWDIPARFTNRLLQAALAGWSASSRLSAHTGTPFSVANYRLPGRVSSNRLGTVLADVTDPNVKTTCGHSAIDKPCFTANQFATTTTQADFGNRPRNSFRGPGFFDIDSSLYKTVALRDRARFTLGASAYNLLNHPNFADPNQNVAGSGLGLIQFTVASPSGPYGLYGGPSGRALVVTGKLAF